MAARKIPQRTCVACGTTRDKRDLVRVVRTPDGALALDATGKRSGRGAYVCRDPQCVERGLKGRIQHVLEVPVGEDVAMALRAFVGTADTARGG
ncbi:MAG: RNase P modulator RnpM [Clostridia bacterium]